jgi:hypothetical protein
VHVCISQKKSTSIFKIHISLLFLFLVPAAATLTLIKRFIRFFRDGENSWKGGGGHLETFSGLYSIVREKNLKKGGKIVKKNVDRLRLKGGDGIFVGRVVLSVAEKA